MSVRGLGDLQIEYYTAMIRAIVDGVAGMMASLVRREAWETITIANGQSQSGFFSMQGYASAMIKWPAAMDGTHYKLVVSYSPVADTADLNEAGALLCYSIQDGEWESLPPAVFAAQQVAVVSCSDAAGTPLVGGETADRTITVMKKS